MGEASVGRSHDPSAVQFEENICGWHNRSPDASFARRAEEDRRLLASLQLSVGGHDLSSREPSSPRAAEAGAHQESAPGSLGLRSGPILDLGPPESGHQEIRLECHLYFRSRAWRASYAVQLLSRRLLLRDLS